MASLTSSEERRVWITPWQTRRLVELAHTERYDAVLACVGYEPRSVAISLALAGRAEQRIAVEYPEQQTGSYMRSREQFIAADFQINREWDRLFAGFFAGWLDELSRDPGRVRVAIDVSSMDRRRIAAVVEALARSRPHGTLSADLLYAPATLRLPPGLPDGVLSIGPVSPYFAGELQAGASTVAVVGLGYEPNKAGGALNTLEIPCAAVYIPTGPEGELREAVFDANRALLDSGAEIDVVDYEILDPFDCLTRLDGRSHALLRAGEVPALVPLGPKIFAVSACIVAAIHYPQVQVWRASFNAREHPLERESDGSACGVSIHVAAAPRAGG